MKEFFAVDLHTGTSESEKLVSKVLSEKTTKEQVDFSNKIKEYEKKATLPTWLVVVRVVVFILAVLFFMAFFANLTQVEDGGKIPSQSWIVFVFAIICLIASCLVTIIKKRRAKKVATSQEYTDCIKGGEELYKRSLNELGIPQDAPSVDVFITVYTTKSGKVKPATKLFDFVNTSVKIFSDENTFSFADLQTVFTLQKSWFKGFEKIEKRVTFNVWHKEKSNLSDEYKQYGVKVNGSGVLYVKNCVKILFEKDETQYYIVIPPYDSDTVLSHIQGTNKKIKKSK